MAALAATTNSTSSLQSAMLRSRVDAARREADRAESYAENLRTQAEAQENVVQQARQRVKAVESAAQASTTTANATSAPKAPSTPSAPTPRVDPTYTNTLADVFRAAKPILESDLSTPQKNIVISGLFDATKTITSSSQGSAPSPAPYQAGVFQSPSQVIGSVLDASA